MQGRLVDSEKKGRIQYFPEKNWAKEIVIARKIGFKIMEWTIDYDNLEKNPIFNGNLTKLKQILKENKLKITSITLDYFMQRPFFKKVDNMQRFCVKKININHYGKSYKPKNTRQCYKKMKKQPN